MRPDNESPELRDRKKLFIREEVFLPASIRFRE